MEYVEIKGEERTFYARCIFSFLVWSWAQSGSTNSVAAGLLLENSHTAISFSLVIPASTFNPTDAFFHTRKTCVKLHFVSILKTHIHLLHHIDVVKNKNTAVIFLLTTWP